MIAFYFGIKWNYETFFNQTHNHSGMPVLFNTEQFSKQAFDILPSLSSNLLQSWLSFLQSISPVLRSSQFLSDNSKFLGYDIMQIQ